MTETITNPAIGSIHYDEESILSFREGMLGLPNFKRYLLLEAPDLQPFLRLQCVDEPSISFLLIDPTFVDADYRKTIASTIQRECDADDEKTGVMSVVNVSDDGSDISANLAAPVIINQAEMTGVQTILMDSPYSVKHNLMPEEPQRKEA